jgi:hypothetical protein
MVPISPDASYAYNAAEVFGSILSESIGFPHQSFLSVCAGSQLIAMGFPSDGTEGIYRNPMDEVRRA